MGNIFSNARRVKRAAAIVCLAAAVLLLASVFVFPAANHYLERSTASGWAAMEGAEYAKAQEQNGILAQLEAQMASRLAEESYLLDPAWKYAALLFDMDRQLLHTEDPAIDIESIEHKEYSSSVRVVFTTRDLDAFLKEQDLVNEMGYLAVEEAVPAEDAGAGRWRYGVSVSRGTDAPGPDTDGRDGQ
ncbi:MAG: hypothetical protein LBT26_05785 [Clostridiales Family XIII bacterium]|jgi:hypothetical protein|nr:hypothetical protein [Clostridiales Family XIII bacterium]